MGRRGVSPLIVEKFDNCTRVVHSVKLKVMSRLKQVTEGLLRHIDKPWYPFLLLALNFIDVFTLVVPLDLFLVAGIFARPKRWFVLGAFAMAGNMLAALVLTLLAQYQLEAVSNYFQSAFTAESWQQVRDFIGVYGYPAALVCAITFIPFQIFILIGAALKMSLSTMLLMIVIGRLIKYVAVSAAAAYAPQLIRRILKVSVPEPVKDQFAGDAHSPFKDSPDSDGVKANQKDGNKPE